MYLFHCYILRSLSGVSKCMNPNESVWWMRLKREWIGTENLSRVILFQHPSFYLLSALSLQGYKFKWSQLPANTQLRCDTNSRATEEKVNFKEPIKVYDVSNWGINWFTRASRPCCGSMCSSEVKQDENPVIDWKFLLLSQKCFF